MTPNIKSVAEAIDRIHAVIEHEIDRLPKENAVVVIETVHSELGRILSALTPNPR